MAKFLPGGASSFQNGLGGSDVASDMYLMSFLHSFAVLAGSPIAKFLPGGVGSFQSGLRGSDVASDM